MNAFIRPMAIPIAITAAMRGITLLLQFVLQLVVANYFGAGGLGLFQVFQTWVCIVSECIAVGMPQSVLKHISITPGHAAKRHLINAIIVLIAKLWLPVFLLLLLVGWGFDLQPLLTLFCFGFSIFLFAIMRVFVESLKAMAYPRIAIAIETGLFPLCILIALGVYALNATQQPPLPFNALITVTAIASLIVAFIAGLTLHKTLGKHPVKPAKATPLLNKEAVYFWGTSLLSISLTSFPFLIMPFYSNLQDIGAFALAFKLLAPITALLIMLASFYGPKFARAAASNDRAELNALLAQTQILSLLIYVPLISLLLFYSELIFSLFGSGFNTSQYYLLMLIITQGINAATGLSGILLCMSGQECKEFKNTVVALLIASVGSVVFGPSGGISAIAISYCTAIIVKNVLSYFQAYRFLHDAKTPFLARAV